MKSIQIDKKDKILIIAPHPDDESIGTGGLLLQYPKQCTVIVATDGRKADDSISPEVMADTRKKEFADAMAVAGVTDYEFLEYPDRELERHPHCFSKIDFSRYSILFLPNSNEQHPDHKAVFKYAIKELERQDAKNISIYMYETRQPNHTDDCYLDISEYIEKKKQMIYCYASQIRLFDHAVFAEAINHFNSCSEGGFSGYYESYTCYRMPGENAKSEQKQGKIWKNPAHEFDGLYRMYSRLLDNTDHSLCVFGAGVYGKRAIEDLKDTRWKVRAVVDNDPEKWGQKLNDSIDIISFDTYLKDYRDSFLLLAVSARFIQDVFLQVEKAGLCAYKDYGLWYGFIEDVIPLENLYKYNELHLNVVELAVTERCTLKCKKCAHGCAFTPITKEDFPIGEVKKSADILFSFVDRITEFYLIGGETFLYIDLAEAIRYIGSRYRDRMTRFVITTNGTIIPSKEVLEAAAEQRMTFYVSNYTAAIPKLADRYSELCKVLESYGIDYRLSEVERQWYDYGFGHVDHKFDLDIVRRTHDECFTTCREIRGSRIYYCIQARSVAENMKFDVSEDDYLELSELDGATGKKIVYEYSRGFCPKGYIDMCNYCNGSESLKHLIPAAEQF